MLLEEKVAKFSNKIAKLATLPANHLSLIVIVIITIIIIVVVVAAAVCIDLKTRVRSND